MAAEGLKYVPAGKTASKASWKIWGLDHLWVIQLIELTMTGTTNPTIADGLRA